MHRVRNEDAATEVVSEQEEQPPPPDRRFTRDLLHHPAYRPDIDGLRALAIIPVVMFHAFPRLLPSGFIGVDIFFVISGFLISGVILKGLQRGSFSFRSFYANRIKRLFPALLVVLCACIGFGWFFLLPAEYLQLGKFVLGGASYVENIVLRRESGYFGTEPFLKPLMHLWSLGIEEQFYLTYPFLVWSVWRLRRNLFAVLAPLVLISFALNVWHIGEDAAYSFLLPQTRFWELWVGGALAYLDMFSPGWAALTVGASGSERTGPSATIIHNSFSTIGMALIAVALLLVRETGFPGWWALLPVGGASLLILGGLDAWINRRILSNAGAVFVGLVSYPLYLWHWPILSFARILHSDELSGGVRVAALMLSFLLAWATWRFVERRIRFGRKIWTKTAALLFASAIVACIGFTIHDRGGFPGRFNNLPADFDGPKPERASTPDCRKLVGVDRMAYCRSLASGAPDVLLVGDSHAGSLYAGLAPAYARRSQALMNLGDQGCVPFYDTDSYVIGMGNPKHCRPSVNRMLDFAASSPSVRTIIFSVRGPLNVLGQGFDPYTTSARKVVSWDGAAKNSSQSEVFAAAFRNTVVRLYAKGKKVVVFVDWPELDFDPKSCLPRPVPFFASARALCGVSRAQVDARNRAYREIVFNMKKEFSGLKVFDPLPYLCDAKTCNAMRDGQLLYSDDNHLSSAGAIFLSDKFLAEASIQ